MNTAHKTRNTFCIGLPYITQPNLLGEQVHETATMLTVKIISVDFTPKANKNGVSYTFPKDVQRYLTGVFVGQMRKYRKTTGKEVNKGASFMVL